MTGALTWLEWEEFFKNDPKNLTLQPIIQNPIDDIWLDRPSRPRKELEVHDVKYSGMNIMVHWVFEFLTALFKISDSFA